MIAIEIKPKDVIKAIGRWIVLTAVIGPAFWYFMVQLAKHGW